jgi:hypothetical protein
MRTESMTKKRFRNLPTDIKKPRFLQGQMSVSKLSKFVIYSDLVLVSLF